MYSWDLEFNCMDCCCVPMSSLYSSVNHAMEQKGSVNGLYNILICTIIVYVYLDVMYTHAYEISFLMDRFHLFVYNTLRIEGFYYTYTGIVRYGICTYSSSIVNCLNSLLETSGLSLVMECGH